MGLVGVGSASRSFLARMPSALARLGPVKASSYQVARRLANALRAGYAVSHYSALEPCPLIWVFQPEHSLDRVLQDMAAQMPVHRTKIVLCECERDSLNPSPLRTAGARIASLNVVEESQERLFVAEGHADTLAALDRLLAAEKRTMIEIQPAAKPLYFAGIHLAKYLLLPAISSSVESLRAAGFTREQAARVMEALGGRAISSYGKAGRKAWNPRAEAELRRALERDREALQTVDSQRAAIYVEGIRAALRYFGERAKHAGIVL